MEDQGEKRTSAGDGGPPEKRLKGEPEDTDLYSQRIKKKLQANSRTGQACDRCKVRRQILTFTSPPLHFASADMCLLKSKERKMKCDSGQDGCQPCLSKNLRCMATDRITGITHERGETARLKHDIEKLRTQLNAYYHCFGPLPAEYSVSGSYQTYTNGYSKYVNRSQGHSPNPSTDACIDFVFTSNPPQAQHMALTEQNADADPGRVDNADGPHRGPIHETTIDFVDGEIDISAFECPDMAETMKISQASLPLNNSRRSSLTTILGAQKPEKPQMPPRDETLQCVDNYLNVIAPYVPIVHGPIFKKQVSFWCRKDVTGSTNVRLPRSPTTTIIQAVLTANLPKSS